MSALDRLAKVALIVEASLNSTSASVDSRRSETVSGSPSKSRMPTASEPSNSPAVTKNMGPVTTVVLNLRETSAKTAIRAPATNNQ